MAKAVGFTKESATRIGKAVRAYERGPDQDGQGWYAGGGGDEIVIAENTATTWTKGTSRRVSVLVGPPNTLRASGKNITAWNLFGDIPASKRLAIVGQWVIAAEC